MSAENMDLGALQEGTGTGAEASEEEKQKVAEDGKAAQKAHKQVKQSQIKNQKFALLLSQILKRYYSNENIVSALYDMIQNLDKYEKNIEIVFAPFINGEGFKAISDYIDYLSMQKNSINSELIFEIIEFENIGGKTLWKNLKSGKTEISYKDFKKQILDELSSK